MDNLSSGVGNMGLGGSGSGRPRLPNIIDKHIATAEAESSTSRVQPQQQEGAWSTVKNGRRSTVSFADPPAQQTRRVPSSTTRPRRSAYSPPKKAYLKQSCLPTEDQDKDLLEVEELKSHKLAREDFKPGMIIRALVHEQDYQASSSRSNITVADKYRSDTKYGPIYTKARKMIVLSLFEDHYTAIPVFTHNGNGLDRKNRPEEFVSIKDHRAKYEVPPLSLNGQLVTDTMFPGAKVFDVKSTAHVTYALSRRYDMPCVKEGHLTKKSSNHLIKLFNAYAPRFLTDERGRVIQ
ncbi:MAG: hypothetical protein LQ349_008896 [Xanthoria aureola]|nr:MAG: hypothetical protein LQ349_008896 [Xanthoria aureola]